MTGRDWIVVGACFALAVLGYLAYGRPFMPDRPFSERNAELAAKDPAEMTPAETLARLEVLTREKPDDPEPHFFIGELLRAQGRDEDAMRAYQSSLRRDDAFVPAYLGLADAVVRLAGGSVSEDAQRLYARAYALDPEQLRAGFMAGLADWQAGRAETAETAWAGLSEPLAADDPRRAMLAAWIEAAKEVE